MCANAPIINGVAQETARIAETGCYCNHSAYKPTHNIMPAERMQCIGRRLPGFAANLLPTRHSRHERRFATEERARVYPLRAQTADEVIPAFAKSRGYAQSAPMNNLPLQALP